MAKDPKLKKTVNRMIKIARENDMAAYVVVVSPERSESRMTFPNWSVITLEKGVLRFRSKKEDFDSKELQHIMTENSVHIIMQMRDLFGMALINMEKLINFLRKHMDIKHVAFDDFEPHDDSEE